MAVYVGGKKVQETGGKYQSKGIPEKSSSRPHHTKRERVGSRETGFTFRDTPITGGKPPHTPAEQFEALRLRKDELQHIPYSGDDSGRNMYQMGIQNLLGHGDAYKKAYLQKYPIGGRINLGVPAAFNAIMSKVVPGVSSIANMFGNKLSGVGQGIKNVFSGPTQDLGFHGNKFMQDLSQTPSRFWNNLQSMLGGNTKSQYLADVKTTQTTEDIISPAALSRTSSVETPQYNDIFQPDERIFKLPLTEGNQKYKFRNQYFQPDAPWDEFGNYLMQNPQGKGQGLYAAQMAHGGEIQDDAFARLKAINDSMHEM